MTLSKYTQFFILLH